MPTAHTMTHEHFVVDFESEQYVCRQRNVLENLLSKLVTVSR